MIPQEGEYHCKKITPKELKKYFKGEWKSYIGYPQNAKILSEILGVNIPINREKVGALQDGDIIIAMRLKYRIDNPRIKGKKINKNDFEYYIIKYKEV